MVPLFCSHVAETKKKGSPTPAGGAQNAGQTKPQPGAPQKDAKGGKGNKTPASKDAPKEVLKESAKEAEKAPQAEPPKGKSPPASQAATAPAAAAKPAPAATPAAAPAAAPAVAAAAAPADAKADKGGKNAPKAAAVETAAEPEGESGKAVSKDRRLGVPVARHGYCCTCVDRAGVGGYVLPRRLAAGPPSLSRGIGGRLVL